MALQGCGTGYRRPVPVRSQEDYYGVFPGFGAVDSVFGSGRARIEFRNYRFRGKFRFELRGDDLRVDFTHSSLLGAVETEGSFFLAPDGMTLVDHHGGRIYGNEECLRLAEEAVGASITAGDIMLALQFSYPGFPEVESAKTYREGRRWILYCTSRQRELELSGEKPGRLDMLRIRRADGGWSFRIGYRYGSFAGRYPERIMVEGGDESVSITLKVENYIENGEKL
jgi:hypothetical protein